MRHERRFVLVIQNKIQHFSYDILNHTFANNKKTKIFIRKTIKNLTNRLKFL